MARATGRRPTSALPSTGTCPGSRSTSRRATGGRARPRVRGVHHAMVDHAGITMADVLGSLRDPGAVIGPAAERLVEIRRGAGGRPVVAVGLSLGGIILVDTLAALLRDEAPAAPRRRPAGRPPRG